MPRRPVARPRPRAVPPRRKAQTAARGGLTPEDRFCRQIVSSMRNGVIAILRDGTVALMKEEAYRIFSLSPDPRDVGRPLSEVFHRRPDVARVLSSAFELMTLPNR